jgi:hypothetical protein
MREKIIRVFKTDTISPYAEHLNTFRRPFFCVVEGPAADATDAPQPSVLCVKPCDEDD